MNPRSLVSGVVRIAALCAAATAGFADDYRITQMVADVERPYVYAIDRGYSTNATANLLFINTETELVEKVIPIGPNPTDMTIHYGEERLYVTNWLHPNTRVVDLVTQEELPPLELGTDVFRINAGRPGRVYYEEEDQWIDIKIIDTATGAEVGQFRESEGDGEIDPTGNFYYHSDNGTSSVRITKYDISTDDPVELAESRPHSYQRHRLLISGDGNRLFWRGYVHDTDLNELRYLGEVVHATTLHGDLAFSSSQVYNAHNGLSLFTLPIAADVMAVSGDQSKLFLYDEPADDVLVIPMSDIVQAPAPALHPDPEDGSTVLLPVDRLAWDFDPFAVAYQVYLGSDAISVANAGTTSPEYLGRTTDDFVQLTAGLNLGQTYYWRVDSEGLADLTPGAVWSFTVAPLFTSPTAFAAATVTGGPALHETLELTAGAVPVAWEVSSTASWLTVSQSSGVTPDQLELTLDPLGLDAGTYVGELQFESGAYQFELPVQLELHRLKLGQMATDLERPYIYALHIGSGADDAFLLFIHTETELVEKVIPIGALPTDMAIHYGEGRLYVTNFEQPVTRIVDLATQMELPPLELGTDVFRINAGRTGRIYYEELERGITIIDTATGAEVGGLVHAGSRGNAEIDPTGSYYYHGKGGISSANIIKYDISTDNMEWVASGPERGSGSFDLLMSGDGTRLFWAGYAYDADLNELIRLHSAIYATTMHGELAFSRTHAYNVHNAEPIFTLPFPTRVMAVSGDQSKLFLFDDETSEILVIPTSDVAGLPGPAADPDPEDGSTVVLPVERLGWNLDPLALYYDVYLGTDAAAVANADSSSAEYVGRTTDTSMALDGELTLGETYFWRVDLVGFSGVTVGAVWDFTVAPLIVSPNAVAVGTVMNSEPLEVTLELSAGGASVAWSVVETLPWLSVSHTNGATPDTIVVTLDTAGLDAGTHQGTLEFASGAYTFGVPVQIELFEMQLTQMVADRQRPYIYALSRGIGYSDPAFLLFISTETELVENVIPIGVNPTDMTINYGEDRLYVTNWLQPETRVVDLSTQTELPSLSLGTEVYKINAGRPGRVYYEEEDQTFLLKVADTSDGTVVGYTFAREGDGEISPAGDYYYHGDSTSIITKYDISTDDPVAIATSLPRMYGSRRLLMSGDGSRLFWRDHVFDTDLNVVGYLGREIFATTLHGDLAFSSDQVHDGRTGDPIFTLPVSTTVMAVSGDQTKLFLFDEEVGNILTVAMSDIADVPGPGLHPVPADGATIALPLEKLAWSLDPFAHSFEVYLGADAAAVADADTSSPQYLGQTTGGFMMLTQELQLSQTYYWRLDRVGLGGVTRGDVWSFTTAPLRVSPNVVAVIAATHTAAPDVVLELSSGGVPIDWSVSEAVPWLSVSPGNGMTPGNVVLSLDTTGLEAGDYAGRLEFESGPFRFEVPVTLELFELNLTQMVTDYERPYIYGLHPGVGSFNDTFLLFINTESQRIDKAIRIGLNPTDMTVHYGEARLYVTNWRHRFTRVVDLETRTELPPLDLGPDVFNINAGRPGRIYYEEEDQSVYIRVIDTASGAQVGLRSVREGDGEIDPTGTHYYHSRERSRRITKYDISTDNPAPLVTGPQVTPGSRRLLMSHEGNRLFWRGHVFDADLNLLNSLGEDVYATTADGAFAFGTDGMFDAQTAARLDDLPLSSQVMTVSNDGRHLFMFAEGQIVVVDLDRDGDGMFDPLDNCPDVANAEQLDIDEDGAGDVCDRCPNISNPQQAETVACIAIDQTGGRCLETAIDLVEGAGDEVLIVGSIIPTAVTFELLSSSCGAPGTYEFFLNSTLLSVEPADPNGGCLCEPELQVIVVSDEDLLAAAWDFTGPNTLRVVKQAPDNAFGWVRARVETGQSAETLCLYDAWGGSCDDPDLCNGGFTFDPVIAEGALQAQPQSPSIMIPFEDADLPRLIDVGPLADGGYSFCVVDDGVSDCVAFIKQGERWVGINGEICELDPPVIEVDLPVLEAALPPYSDRVKTRTARIANTGEERDLIWSVEGAGEGVSPFTAEPVSGTVTPGGFADIVFRFSSADLNEADWQFVATIHSDDPFNDEVAIPFTLHVSEVELDWLGLDLTPKGQDASHLVEAALQLPSEYDPADVVISSVSFEEELFATPAPVRLEDRNGDGVRELILQFDALSFERLATGGATSVTLTGEVRDQTWFRGEAILRTPGQAAALP